MRKCIYCRQGIHDDAKLIAVYDDKTQNIWFFLLLGAYGEVVRERVAKEET